MQHPDPLTPSRDAVLQGKYINDPEVLKEAAKAAGVEEYEWAIQDPTIVLDQVAARIDSVPYCTSDNTLWCSAQEMCQVTGHHSSSRDATRRAT